MSLVLCKTHTAITYTMDILGSIPGIKIIH